MRNIKKIISLTVAASMLAASMDISVTMAQEKGTDAIITEVEVTESVPIERLNTVEPKSNNQKGDNGIYNGYTYKIKDDNTIAIIKFEPDAQIRYDAVLTVPAEIHGYKVTEIGKLAFQEADFDEIVIPNTVTKIGEDAFMDSKIKAITIPKSVSELEDVCFARCYNLKEASILGKISKCGVQVFLECSSLETVVFGEGIEVIGEQFFGDCTSLKTVEIPSSVKALDSDGCFGNAFAFSSLENIVISKGNKNFKLIDGVVYTYDGTELIYAPISIDKHIIPLTTKKINIMAFCKNDVIEEIIIPASVDSIQEMAFDYCSNLKTFYFCNPKAFIDNNAIFAYNFFTGWDPSDINIYGFEESTAYDLAKSNGMRFKTFSDNILEYVCDTVGHYYLENSGRKKCAFCVATPATITAKNITKTYSTKTFSLGAKVDSNGKLTYTSADTKVATVSSAGKVTLKGYGKTTITIKAAAKWNYKAAQKKIVLTVKPKTMSAPSLKSAKAKNLTVSWKKDAKATGYVMQYSTDKNFKKNVKTVTISKAATTSKKISKLTSKKKYYVRVCAYKKISGGKLTGSYSKAKSVTIK